MSILSTSKSQSLLVSLFKVIRMPRCFKGNSPLSKHVTCRILFFASSGTLPKYIVVLAWLTYNPDVAANAFKVLFSSNVESTFPLLNNIKSSAKMIWLRDNETHLWLNWNSLLFPILFISLEKYFIVMTKSNGGMGSPCLRPYLPSKNHKFHHWNSKCKLEVKYMS